jgi:hypothetical protein
MSRGLVGRYDLPVVNDRDDVGQKRIVEGEMTGVVGGRAGDRYAGCAGDAGVFQVIGI